MRALIFILAMSCFCLGQAHAIEVNRNVETAPIVDVPPPEDAPKLPPPSNAPVSAAPKHLDARQAPTDAGDLTPAVLTSQDKADLSRIQTYLNQLKSIQADFLQIDDQGNTMRGSIAILRPGKMRVTYAPPSKDFIVADGSMVHIWDGSLKSQTNVPQSSSLANFILRDPIVLGGEVTVVDFERYPAKLEVSLVQSNDPNAGRLTLIFEDHPLLLRQWRVLDAQGRTTGVNLENEQSDVHFANGTFNFTSPDFAKTGKSEIP